MKKKIIKISLTLTAIVSLITTTLLIQNSLLEIKKSKAEIPFTEEVLASEIVESTYTEAQDIAIDHEHNTIVTTTNIEATNTYIYYKMFDKNGVAKGNATKVHFTESGTQNNPSISADKYGNFVIAYTELDIVSNTYSVIAVAFQSDGTKIGDPITVSSSTEEEPLNTSISVKYNSPEDSSRFIISWTSNENQNESIFYRLYNVDFTQTEISPTSETNIKTFTDSNAKSYINSSVQINSAGQYIISGSFSTTTDTKSFFQIFAQDHTQLTEKTYISSPNNIIKNISATTDKQPRQTLNDTENIKFILSYEKQNTINNEKSISSKIIECQDPDQTNNDDTDIICSLLSKEITDSLDKTETKENPSIDADHLGNFVVTWQGTGFNLSSSEIIAQTYDYNGSTISSAFQVNKTKTLGTQKNPHIAMNEEGFFDIVFFNNQEQNIYFKKYTTEIFKLENETLIHTPDNTNSQNQPATAISPTDNQVIVWIDFGTSPRTLKYTLQRIDRSDPENPEIIKIKDQQIIATGNNIYSPSVDFFKDDTNCNKFIVVWNNDLSTGNSQDIFYNIYDSSGAPEYLTPQTLASTGDYEVNPTVSAGIYNNGTTNVKTFSAGWINFETSKIETIFHEENTFYPAIIETCDNGICPMLGNLKNSLNPYNNKIVFSYNTMSDGSSKTYIQQLEADTIIGTKTELDELNSNSNDIAFITQDDFIIVYKTGYNNPIKGSRYKFNKNGITEEEKTPILIEEFIISQKLSPAGGTHPTISANPTENKEQQKALVAWYHYNNSSNDYETEQIYGQFLDYSSDTVKLFGPSFKINSSNYPQGQNISVGYNKYGIGIVAWDGESELDDWGINYQLLHIPELTSQMIPFEPICRQEITAGGLTMNAPETISFPALSASATKTEEQEISIRDTQFGGDIKYIEIQDATGEDFTLSIMVSDFISQEDGKSYIKSNEHFKVKNWDNSTTDTNPSCSKNTSQECFSTEKSTYTPTAFSLNTETEEYTFANNQKVLATKENTQKNEIGRWRIYPKFWISVPPIIPAGLHEAVITFTLVN